MHRFLFILFSVGLINFNVNAQVVLPEKKDTVIVEDTIKTDESVEQEIKTDIIYQHDGNKMLVDVKKIYLNDLYYSLPGETKVNKMDQRLVHKIEYKSGKIEILNETPPDVREVGDI